MKIIEDLPIYQKAISICKLVESFMLAIPQDDIFLQQSKGMMLEDAFFITTKIVGAEGGDLYSIRMENAAIVREHAIHLSTQIGSLRFHSKFKDVEYITLIRQELDEFRLLFIEWVASFDSNNHIWDEWELFNPSGAIRPNDFDDNFFGMEDFLDDDE